MANRIYADPEVAGQFLVERAGVLTATIRFNAHTGSLRLQVGEERRLFLLEADPSPAARMQLFTEYGIRTASAHIEDARLLRGSVRWEGMKFRFQREGSQIHLVLDGKPIDQFGWELEADCPPHAVAGILMLLCRQEIAALRTAV